MIYNQIANFPIIIENVNLSTLQLSKLFRKFNLSFSSILVVCGKSFSAQYAKMLIQNNMTSIKRFYLLDNASNSLSFINAIEKTITLNNYDLIIGLGGGKVLDTAKYLATKKNINYIGMPTVISNDGVVSPIAILLDNENQSVSLPTRIPMGVLIDKNLFRSSSSDFFLSGLGDIISNYTALLDWDLAIEENYEKPNNLARLMANLSVENIMDVNINQIDDHFLDHFVESIILSGLAMNISGNSRPCSGSEHLISHVIMKHRLSRTPHGFQVGSITPFIVWLHQKRDDVFFNFIKQMGFAYDFIKLIGDDFDFMQLLDEARIIRGERYTILNKFTNEELMCSYKEFVIYMHKF